MEQEMNNKYREIAEKVNEMIPERWETFHFYAQISESGGGTYFYYNEEENLNEFKYSLEIPFKYKINTEKFDDNEMELYDLSEALRLVFEKYEQELWYSFTMSLTSAGKLNVHYDYTDWASTDYDFSDQMIIWKYKYLNEKPQDEKLQGIIEKYLAEYPNNPI
ncbi:DUF600 family protein [Listeria sp. FSL L7-1582]|uniref:immunity protein YezG family protein n=1 Tax=Listeria portnoyi TaxID=2713504 RepID=UPI00164CE0A3|nr:immunity protein YezG family protein [Listeria portnoyi]MBC6310022.1 DUF600 family protein [Listeria portnoyi]